MQKKTQGTLAHRRTHRRIGGILVVALWVLLLSPLYAQQEPTEPPYALYKQGRHREAIDAALLLIEADKSNISAFVVASIAYIGLGQWANALQIAQEGYQYAPNDLRLVLAIAESYYALKQNKESLRYLSEYLRKGPNEEVVDLIYFYIAQIYSQEGKLFKADISMAAAVSYRPNNIEWLLLFATIKEQKNEKEEAIALYRKVLQLDPSNRLARQKIQVELLSN